MRGLIRNPDHAADLRADGSEPVVCDLERRASRTWRPRSRAPDAVVFAAGAGPGSGAQRKLTVDRDGAIKLLAAARSAAVERYVMVSSIGAEQPPDGDDVFSVYLRAKAQADAALAASDRAWTIVRPGSLTDEPGTGRVRLTAEPVRGDGQPRRRRRDAGRGPARAALGAATPSTSTAATTRSSGARRVLGG